MNFSKMAYNKKMTKSGGSDWNQIMDHKQKLLALKNLNRLIIKKEGNYREMLSH